jgi:hypothetical protein
MSIQAYTIAGFCEAYRISRSLLYKLWQMGRGPTSYPVGRRRYISFEAARRWQHEREAR